jgi:hypothetical protein
MITTDELIRSLAAEMKPVRRLRPPLFRAACWLLLGTVVLTLLAINQGIRPDLLQRLREPAFAASMAGSMLTGILAAVAAFIVSLPDRSRLWLLLPAPALVIWLSNIGYQCMTQWVAIGPDGIDPGEAARCFATLVLASLPLSLAMLVMLRYAALVRPTAVAFTGGIAVAAITATALSLFHSADASAMILMWSVGTAILFGGIGGLFGRHMFGWVAARAEMAS